MTTHDTALARTTGAADLAPWESKLDVIRRNYAEGATDNEFEVYLYKARRYGLEPGTQIHFTKRAGRMAIITAIDGYRLLAERTGHYAGNDEATYTYAADAITQTKPNPITATVTVWKLVGGQRCPFTATARWDEYNPGPPMDFMWKKMPHTMLAKCAEAKALRKAFPAELSGLYTDDEMQQAGAFIEQAAVEQPALPYPGTPIHEDAEPAADMVEAPTDPLWLRWLATCERADVVSVQHAPLTLPIQRTALIAAGKALADAVALAERQAANPQPVSA